MQEHSTPADGHNRKSELDSKEQRRKSQVSAGTLHRCTAEITSVQMSTNAQPGFLAADLHSLSHLMRLKRLRSSEGSTSK